MDGNEIDVDICELGATRHVDRCQIQDYRILAPVAGCSKDVDNLNLEMLSNVTTPVTQVVNVGLHSEVISRVINVDDCSKRRNEVLAKYHAQMFADSDMLDDEDEFDSDFSNDTNSEDEFLIDETQDEETETYKKDVDKIERFLAADDPGEEFLANSRTNPSASRRSSRSKGNISNKTPADECLAANKKCLEVLIMMEEDLRTKLEKIRVQYNDVTKRIEHCATFKEKANRGSLFTQLTRLGIPYFKDKQFFHCPGNEDYFKKKARKEYVKHHFIQDRCWTHKQYRLVSEAVRKWEIEGLEMEKEREIEALTRLLHATDDPEEVERLKVSIRAVEKRCFDHLKLKDVVGKRQGNYDWLKISAQDLNGEKSADECIAMWDHCINPKVNTGDWSAEEDLKLKEITAKYNFQDWDAIATELGTNRTPFLCVCRFRTQLHDEVMNVRFTREEDDLLLHHIENTRVGNYICWSKVEFLVKGRSRKQIINRWLKLKPKYKKGRFTDQEDLLILSGVRELGNNNFTEVAKRFVPGRVPTHVRNRYMALIDNGTSGMWSKEEDKLLVNLVVKWGTDWRKISESFHNRNKAQLRFRYQAIERHFVKKAKCDANQNEEEEEDSDVQVPTRKPNKRVVREKEKNKKLLKRFAKMTKKELELALMKKKLHKKNNKRSKNGILDVQFQEYFNIALAYPQKVGRESRECVWSEQEVEDNTQLLKSLFTLSAAKLNIPSDDDVIMSDHLLSEGMKQSLITLRDSFFNVTRPTETAVEIPEVVQDVPELVLEAESNSPVTVDPVSTADIDLPLCSDIDNVTFTESALGIVPRQPVDITEFSMSYTSDVHVNKTCAGTTNKNKAKVIHTGRPTKLAQLKSKGALKLPSIQNNSSVLTLKASGNSTKLTPDVGNTVVASTSSLTNTTVSNIPAASLTSSSGTSLTQQTSQGSKPKLRRVIRLNPKTSASSSNVTAPISVPMAVPRLPVANRQVVPNSNVVNNSSVVNSSVQCGAMRPVTLPPLLGNVGGIYSDRSLMWDDALSLQPSKKIHRKIVAREPRVPGYTLPPSHTTLCGLRTLLLSRDRINTEDKKNHSKKYRTQETVYPDISQAAEEAERLWKARLDLLFTWPGLMAGKRPAVQPGYPLGMRNLNTFLDDDDIPQNAGGKRRRSSSNQEEEEEEEEEEDVDDPDEVDVSQQVANSQPSTSRNNTQVKAETSKTQARRKSKGPRIIHTSSRRGGGVKRRKT